MGRRFLPWAAMALVLFSARLAGAQAAPSPTVSPAPKSPWIAAGLSVGVTAAGLGIGAFADAVDPEADSPATIAAFVASYAIFAAGPSAGHWYAGERGHALRWTAIRGAGLAALAGGLYLALDADDDRGDVPGVLLAAGGATALAVGLYWDFYDSPRAARRANRRAAAQLQLAPLGARGAGLVLGGTF
jgi:hypothetical protein